MTTEGTHDIEIKKIVREINEIKCLLFGKKQITIEDHYLIIKQTNESMRINQCIIRKNFMKMA